MTTINVTTVFNMDIFLETVLMPSKKKTEVTGIMDGTMTDGVTSTSTSGTIKVRRGIHNT